MGVWIETKKAAKYQLQAAVTPFVGVWIETRNSFDLSHRNLVTPFVGVWIETLSPELAEQVNKRHTLRGCVD